jgi:hypothetical protein
MHGFDYREIDLIMRAVRKEVDEPRDVIFAKTTENSVKMKLSALIEDLCEDHQYLKENPPPIGQKTSEATQPTDQDPP